MCEDKKDEKVEEKKEDKLRNLDEVMPEKKSYPKPDKTDEDNA